MLESPYREITRPIIKYVRDYPARGPRDIVTVIIPEYIVGHWWEQLLHNQSALRLKARLLFQPGVVVVDVPWHLRSAGVSRPPGRASPKPTNSKPPQPNAPRSPRPRPERRRR